MRNEASLSIEEVELVFEYAACWDDLDQFADTFWSRFGIAVHQA